MDDRECGAYYHRTGKVPPVTLLTWVAVYNILTGAGYEQLQEVY